MQSDKQIAEEHGISEEQARLIRESLKGVPEVKASGSGITESRMLFTPERLEGRGAQIKI